MGSRDACNAPAHAWHVVRKPPVPPPLSFPMLPTACSDSTNLYPAPNLTVVSDLQPILRSPLAVAVRKGNAALAAT